MNVRSCGIAASRRPLSRRQFLTGCSAAVAAVALAASPLVASPLVAVPIQARAVEPPRMFPPLFRVRMHGHLMAPVCPDGCTVDFRTLDPAEAIVPGDLYFVWHRNGQGTFRRVAAVRAREIVLVSINRDMPTEIFSVPRRDIASMAEATGVLIPVKYRPEPKAHRKARREFFGEDQRKSQRKSGDRKRLSHPQPASKGTRRAAKPIAA